MKKISVDYRARPRDLAVALGNAEETLSYQVGNLWLPAGSFSSVTMTGKKIAVFQPFSQSVNMAGWVLAESGDTAIAAYVRRHAEWTGGSMSLRVHYSGYQPILTKNFYLLAAVVPVYDGYGGTTANAFDPSTYTTVGTQMGTANAASYLLTSDAIYITFASSFSAAKGFVIYLERPSANALDTATVSMYIHGVELEHIPSPRNTGGQRRYRTTGR